jgi:MFS family permease
MIWWGKYVDTIGSRNVLVACGFMIPLVPFFWALTTKVWLLFMIELFSGLIWAGFNLSVSTYLFDATDRKRRTQELAEYTLMIQLAIFIGAMIGSALLGIFDKTDPQAFIMIFLVSAALRLLAIAMFYKKLKELRIVEVPIKERIFKRFVSIRPGHGIIYEPALENKGITSAAMKRPKEIAEEMRRSLRKPRMTKMKEMELQEDEQDMKEYLKKLK